MQSSGAGRLAHRVLSSVGAAGPDCCTEVELGEGRRAGLGIQMMLSGGDRIFAGLGRMGRSSLGR